MPYLIESDFINHKSLKNQMKLVICECFMCENAAEKLYFLLGE